VGHSIALNFEDGVTRFIECRPGETIADASYRAGINIPLDCRDGVCGTCKCRVESGEYDGGDHLEDALTDQEAAEGLALACQTRPKTDLVVAIAASSEACKTGGQTYRARLRSVDRLSETTIAFSLDGVDAFTFLPGQYVNVLVPSTDERRSYSFSSPPGAEALSFLVRNIPPGVMSTFLREKAVPGTPVEFIGPAGSFYLREIKRPLLLLAGGTVSRRSSPCWGKSPRPEARTRFTWFMASPMTWTSSASSDWSSSRPKSPASLSPLVWRPETAPSRAKAMSWRT
jgi:benzoate/toluate 1,2-dioxygenase reductase component